MAFTKTITCPETNQTYTDAYCFVGTITDYGDSCRIQVKVYSSSDDVESYEPCYIKEEICDTTDYPTYFAESVLDDADKTMRSQAQVYVLTTATFTGGTPV